VRRRCLAIAMLGACRGSESLVLGLNLPQKPWEGKEAFVDLLWRASRVGVRAGEGEGRERGRTQVKEALPTQLSTFNSTKTFLTRGPRGNLLIARVLPKSGNSSPSPSCSASSARAGVRYNYYSIELFPYFLISLSPVSYLNIKLPAIPLADPQPPVQIVCQSSSLAHPSLNSIHSNSPTYPTSGTPRRRPA
jgi:hypothetical protein